MLLNDIFKVFEKQTFKVEENHKKMKYKYFLYIQYFQNFTQ